MIAEGIASGHVTAADVLFLIAVVIFAVAAIITVRTRMVMIDLVSVGLAVVALAWLLL